MRAVLVGLAIVAVAFAAKKCGQNEELKECGSACEPKCSDREPMMCTMQCIPNVCQCKSGYLRDNSGRCVSVCPRSRRSGPTCETMRCSSGFKCEQIRINCYVAPCPQPPPRCVRA